ncbi:Uncharacterised protein [Kluyvera cryocrescens]|uniref:Uncharacterized protein n=1 Tax=Kluyvera cryocrescens TaxID=580 RepID=A0A485B0Q0_KLUCR|nr:Uncharacterised protein [Kluyvera cryocrescens]
MKSRFATSELGVIRGSFAAYYLRQRFGTDVTLIARASIDELLDAIDNNYIDYILGDLSSLEQALRGSGPFPRLAKSGRADPFQLPDRYLGSTSIIRCTHFWLRYTSFSSYRHQLMTPPPPPQHAIFAE